MRINVLSFLKVIHSGTKAVMFRAVQCFPPNCSDTEQDTVNLSFKSNGPQLGGHGDLASGRVFMDLSLAKCKGRGLGKSQTNLVFGPMQNESYYLSS